MSGNDDQSRRTIPATPHRIREFRKRGEIARSKELTGAATMFVGGLVLALTAPAVLADVVDLFRVFFGNLGDGAYGLLRGEAQSVLLYACIPTSAAALVTVLGVSAYQLGMPPALSQFKFDPSKPFKFGGLSEMVKPTAAAWRALKSVLKVLFVGIAGWVAVLLESERYVERPALHSHGILGYGVDAGLRVLIYAGGALLLLAMVDFVVAKRRMATKMKMTPEELKREMKQQEGDPEVKKARRRRMQEIAAQRIQHEVPNADVVIVNPTHYAVALRYISGKDDAPRVVAKGVDTLAARIREVARANQVPIVSKPPLARLLYRTVREGRAIPSELFAAVAEVLSYVYRLRRQAG